MSTLLLDTLLVQFTRDRLTALSVVALGLDLCVLTDALSHADALLPIVDPTRYHSEMRELNALRDLAEAMRGVQRAAERLASIRLAEARRPHSVEQADARAAGGAP